MYYYGRHRGWYGKWSPEELKVADERTKAKAERSFLGRCCSCCSPKCFEIRCICLNIWLLVVFFCMLAVTLIVVGVVVVLPFTKTRDFRETTCHAVKVSENTQRLTCGCGKHCSSFYPCLEIYVNYTRFDNTQVFAMLHENERFGECTYKPNCRSDESYNSQQVAEYQALYGNGSYPCLYNPAVGSTDVLRSHLLTEEGMIHALLWPSIVIFLCLLGFAVIALTCGFTYVCKFTPPQDVKDAAKERELQNKGNKSLEGYGAHTNKGCNFNYCG